MDTREHGTPGDEGFTLVELVIYGLLAVGVLLTVGTILVGSMNIERTVRESTSIANAAQLAARSIESGVRNASAVTLNSVGDDQLLMARTAGSDPDSVTWRCIAWYFSSDSGTIRQMSTASDSVPVTTPTAEPTNWALLASDIQPPASGKIFDDDNPPSVTMEFIGSAGTAAPITISTSVAPRAGAEGSASCF